MQYLATNALPTQRFGIQLRRDAIPVLPGCPNPVVDLTFLPFVEPMLWNSIQCAAHADELGFFFDVAASHFRRPL